MLHDSGLGHSYWAEAEAYSIYTCNLIPSRHLPGKIPLESVRMTSTIAAKHNLKLWRLDFVGAYLNSTTKEDIYMKQAKGFIKLGFKDHVYKLLHTIYGTMQGDMTGTKHYALHMTAWTMLHLKPILASGLKKKWKLHHHKYLYRRHLWSID